jgi:DeoR family glycerol-3-phosphate regulon repressor
MPPKSEPVALMPRGFGKAPRMLAEARHALIAEAVVTRGFVSVTALAAELMVSEMTIRRDLDELERDGRLVRTHGGGVAPDGIGGAESIDREEPAFEARLRENREAKERIAAVAAELAADRKTVALDIGSTTYCLAMRLLERADLRVFTNSLQIASLLAGGRGHVYVPGGRVRREELSIGGPLAVAEFENLWFDIAFVGVSGITKAGFFDYSPEENEMKGVYLRRSSRKVVLCDSSKMQRMSLVRVAGLEEVDTIVTDADPPDEIAAALAAAGVELRIATARPGGGAKTVAP